MCQELLIQYVCVPGSVLGTEETDKQNQVPAFMIPILEGRQTKTRDTNKDMSSSSKRTKRKKKQQGLN